MKILLVEDDQPTATLLSEALTAQHYTVDLATDGKIALDLATAWDFDLILLDVQIPRLDGLGLCRQLRAKGYQKPILLLTAKNSTADVIQGFDAGADDYVTKPCEITELLARIRALLRRGETTLAPAVLSWGELCLNPVSAEVTYRSQALSLTPKEYNLLELFLRNPQRIFDRSAIIDRIWSIDDLPSEGAVTNLIKNLRQKLKAVGMVADMLETVYGLGYRLKTPLPPAEPVTAPPAAGQPSQEAASQESASQEAASGKIANGEREKQQQGLASVNKVLDRFREAFIDRIASLERAEQALRLSDLSPALRLSAYEDAHKLAGGLGMFGYEAGSRLARAIEHLLIGDRPLTSSDAAQLSQQVKDLQRELARPPQSLTTLAQELLSPVPPRRVTVVSYDGALVERLKAEANAWGCQIEVVPYLTVQYLIARQKLAHAQPDIVLLDLDTESESALLEELIQQFPTLPVLAFIAPESLPHLSSRLGRQYFLPKPILATQVFESITQLAAPGGKAVAQEAARVMIVDDDPVILEALSALLQPQGFQVSVLENPQQFWEVLTAIAPDLLLLDLEMPAFSGIDLCQEVRQNPNWKNLPILVVTAHTDIPSLRQVFAAGANDFISKPIVKSELITRVLNQLDRIHFSRSPLASACV
ncbi:MAG: response regulator [Oscillatoriophycideae cyanobacterium NC_groundwater_1537_Pr4_S-0.65um_50_18]|nr:response regulator [Oscillatoriophycideae cyanobacterium NC_groundwater_1537_Pr4_S-0.65um_50_18]